VPEIAEAAAVTGIVISIVAMKRNAATTAAAAAPGAFGAHRATRAGGQVAGAGAVAGMAAAAEAVEAVGQAAGGSHADGIAAALARCPGADDGGVLQDILGRTRGQARFRGAHVAVAERTGNGTLAKSLALPVAML